MSKVSLCVLEKITQRHVEVLEQDITVIIQDRGIAPDIGVVGNGNMRTDEFAAPTASFSGREFLGDELANLGSFLMTMNAIRRIAIVLFAVACLTVNTSCLSLGGLDYMCDLATERIPMP